MSGPQSPLHTGSFCSWSSGIFLHPYCNDCHGQWYSGLISTKVELNPPTFWALCWHLVLMIMDLTITFQHAMKSQSSRLSFPETSLPPGEWNTNIPSRSLVWGLLASLLLFLGKASLRGCPGWAPSCPIQNFPGGLTFSKNFKLKNCVLDPKS